VSYVDFTITFEGDENQSIDDVKSGVEAINGGLGIAVTKSSGMVDNRTISAITPVDEHTSDVPGRVHLVTPTLFGPARTVGLGVRRLHRHPRVGEEVFLPGRPRR
jgi:hypothetical protein